MNKIVDKEAKMVAMRKQFLKDNWEKPNEDNYEFKRSDNVDKVSIIEEVNDHQEKKRLNMFKVDVKNCYV